MSLIFYDTETTGKHTAFDQILQFAAICTDEDLVEIDRFEIRCRLLPHIIPSPEAMNVTGVRVSQLTDHTCPSHYQMMRAICAKLQTWTPALFLGWNSIEFDEHLIRQALYQTLHNPYLTNREGNNRSDVKRIIQACSLFEPHALIIPAQPDGRKIFKLDHVAPANGFRHDRAHEAMGDAEATLFLSRIIAKKAPNTWSAFMRFAKKATVEDYIQADPFFCLSDFYGGRPYSWIVTTIGQNQDIKPEWYVYNLEVEPELLMSLPESHLAARLEQQPKPVRRLKSNAVPMLFSADDAPEICAGRECGQHELQRRTEVLQLDAPFRRRLISAFESLKESYPKSLYVEQQIYDRFVEKPDEKLMANFHEADWVKRPAIVEKFNDPRLKTIGWQLIHVERPDLLDDKTRRELDMTRAKRVMGMVENPPWLTLPQALKEFEAVKADLDGALLDGLIEHEKYLQHRHELMLIHLHRPNQAAV
jgi:exodeoxyribonuclease I